MVRTEPDGGCELAGGRRHLERFLVPGRLEPAGRRHRRLPELPAGLGLAWSKPQIQDIALARGMSYYVVGHLHLPTTPHQPPQTALSLPQTLGETSSK